MLQSSRCISGKFCANNLRSVYANKFCLRSTTAKSMGHFERINSDACKTNLISEHDLNFHLTFLISLTL